jgi:hypothetical protein
MLCQERLKRRKTQRILEFMGPISNFQGDARGGLGANEVANEADTAQSGQDPSDNCGNETCAKFCIQISNNQLQSEERIRPHSGDEERNGRDRYQWCARREPPRTCHKIRYCKRSMRSRHQTSSNRWRLINLWRRLNCTF